MRDRQMSAPGGWSVVTIITPPRCCEESPVSSGRGALRGRVCTGRRGPTPGYCYHRRRRPGSENIRNQDKVVSRNPKSSSLTRHRLHLSYKVRSESLELAEREREQIEDLSQYGQTDGRTLFSIP